MALFLLLRGAFDASSEGGILRTTRTGHEKTVLERQIETTDRRIDRLVYELYDLTDEEIAIVEKATG